ncbi:MAG: Cys-tRNA(Pro) deacylase [Erysipelotrichaceae bacterium]|nr:Cys-tRNA(Pro) deacylase [Solobacterium sp.]MDO4192100.1 Cys-tRNA(Pro) deacylase [Erysipelotrichaceae bacterium]MDO5122778.1 Cys-tRNA(Pro) deacylase [Erysipelotrichaceae bacterium]
MADKKTNAMRILDSEGIAYTVHTYDASDGIVDGVTAARKLGQDPDQVFKTLVTRGNDRQFYVFVIPVKEELDLKACARSVDVRSVEMIHVKELQGITGYIRGGCSPVGMKKQFRTVFDETVLLFDHVFVSGGRIGTQIEVDPEDLIRITGASAAAIIRE